eukprot:2640209-Alexandrium_andersonii.AAC.1
MAIYPPGLRAAILRGIAAQRSLELAQGRAIYDLSEDAPVGEQELHRLAAEAAGRAGPVSE